MAIAKKNLVSITVKRKTRTSNGGGGYTTNPTEITGSPFSGRKLRTRKPVLIEDGPSNIEVDEIVLVFNAGTDIQIGDICTVGLKDFNVCSLREYTRSLQADVEVAK
jgi:hypothetical protein